ncbi:MAG: alpha-D-ribose 1-methylphosphonate 5-triphosphate diphosphatase [Hyphomicrobiaceae bacterium]|nr:alpha-D-ribose 1-methylphosphonate 5-triphosphate diphosphatase [Hyphomicrobiaceae bacterium]
MQEIVFKNAAVVLPDEVVKGSVVVVGGRIRDVASGDIRGPGQDLGGDYLLPGLVELHTDHLETHLQPRPKVRWPAASAIAAFDAQIAASGITTVFDCIRAGRDIDHSTAKDELLGTLDALRRAGDQGLLRAEHRLHVRCEVCVEDVVEITSEAVASHPVHLISLMDHTPGARQFRAMHLWRTYYGGKTGLSPDELDVLIAKKLEQYNRNYRRHRTELVALAKARGIVLASHDDTTIEQVEESIADDVAIAEFPTTLEAAKRSHEADVKVVMGAPNVVRGGSHSGNVAAETLAREGVLDILSSDYVPASLLLGAFDIAQRIEGIGLPAALRTVTLNPARAVRLDDRGEIAVGKRADLVRVRVVDDMPIVREVYREGSRVV